MILSTGTTLQRGKYVIGHSLGQGGFGITYEAEQPLLRRKVAIKEFFMKDCCERDEATSRVTVGTGVQRELVEKFRGKFIREAQMIASMDHPGIVRVTDVFEENDTAYYVMENLPGGSLAEKVKKEGPMPEELAEKYICQVAGALDYIHSLSTVHLDVKPSNILLNAKGEAVLIDFGIAKHYDDSGEQTSSTPVGTSKGFAPLEQSRDGDVSQFKPSTDIYALGATYYYLVTGKIPPEASIVNEDGLVRPKSISDKTFRVIEKSMQPRRGDRPQNISVFLDLLGTSASLIQDESTKIISSKHVDIFNNGHDYVDLGLSVKWATCNLGAQRPDEVGSYFAWGEIRSKDSYKVSNYIYNEGVFKNPPLKYNKLDRFVILQLVDDVARAEWGGNWRIPTSHELNELFQNCQMQHRRNGGVDGYSFTGPSGQSIFFPCSGFRKDNKIVSADKIACIWSSVLDGESKWYAGAAEIGLSIAHVVAFVRSYGLPIRPVFK